MPLIKIFTDSKGKEYFAQVIGRVGGDELLISISSPKRGDSDEFIKFMIEQGWSGGSCVVRKIKIPKEDQDEH